MSVATIEVTNVAEDQVPDQSGNLIDVFDITFTVTPPGGSFTTQVPQAGDPVTAASEAIAALAKDVTGILAIGTTAAS